MPTPSDTKEELRRIVEGAAEYAKDLGVARNVYSNPVTGHAFHTSRLYPTPCPPCVLLGSVQPGETEMTEGEKS